MSRVFAEHSLYKNKKIILIRYINAPIDIINRLVDQSVWWYRLSELFSFKFHDIFSELQMSKNGEACNIYGDANSPETQYQFTLPPSLLKKLQLDYG